MLGHCTYYTPRSKVDDPRKMVSEIENYLSTPNHAGACTRLPFGAYDSRREGAPRPSVALIICFCCLRWTAVCATQIASDVLGTVRP